MQSITFSQQCTAESAPRQGESKPKQRNTWNTKNKRSKIGETSPHWNRSEAYGRDNFKRLKLIEYPM